MTPHRYLLRRIDLSPLAKFGCVLGGLALLPPGLVCAVASTQLLGALRTLLAQWHEAELDLGIGLPVQFDFIELLGLETVEAFIIQLVDQPFVLALLIVLIAMIAGGMLIGLSILGLGWVYNLLAALTGGLEVELQEKQRE